MPSATHKAHRVRAGECITSIAKDNGLFWETIWNDPENAELKELRRDPNVLSEGDVVYIREIRRKEESCAAEQRHRFRVKGEPAMLRLCIRDDDRPRANEPYTLEVGSTTYTGTTDAEGKLEHPIPNNAKKAVLKIGPDPDAQDVFELDLGTLEPVREVKGVQQRLANLGFDPGPLDGIMGPRTEAAIKAFQQEHGLTVTGRNDAATCQKLVEVHGS